ncbi:MAG: FAD-dependent oxidoreductase [Myxococcota bacterium]|nr:FAD-dependent oxidoreductase [Myxococcota bacterium]
MDRTVDFIAIGSGAAAMAAGLRAADLGLEALLLEATDCYGGSTAMSGGVCWVPNNPHMAGRGVTDSPEDALTYLRNIVGDSTPDEILRGYVTESRRMVEYLEEKTAVRFEALEKYCDYYPEVAGGKPGGRSMECTPFDGRELGEEFRRIRPPHPQSQVMGIFGLTAREAHTLLANTWQSKLLLVKRLLSAGLSLLARRKWGRDPRLTAGNALIARLRRSLQDRNVELSLSTTVTDLIVEDGRVVGVVAEKDGETLRIGARKGVLLSAGGFSRNKAMREAHQPAPITDEWSAGNLRSLGDGHRMGVSAGGRLVHMDKAWWTPTIRIPRQELAWVIVVEKNLPHSMMVNDSGQRFTNEAAPYLDVVEGMYAADSAPAWLVFDATFRRNYPVGPLAPGYAVPDKRVSKKFIRGFLKKSDTLAGLAEACEVPAQALLGTVERFNGMADTGIDTDFSRGVSLSDRYYGDPRVTPNPCLGRLETPPFYAVRVYPGDLGTKGGLVVDTRGRVLDAADAPIPGLYAAGNCAAPVMGKTYPGAGGTIGPALVVGFLAAEAAADNS